MAFQIFKRAVGDEADRVKPNTKSPAVQPASVDKTDPSMLAPNARATGIDVSEEGHSLSSALQTAALLFASKQIKPAAETLRDAVKAEDGKAVNSWLALLDLLRRSNDRSAYDEVALKFVVQFEKSAPSWDEISTDEPSKAGAVGQQAAFLTLPQALLGEKPAAVTALLAQAKRPKTADARLTVDAKDLTELDAGAAIALASALRTVRLQKWAIEWNGLKELTERIWKPLRAGEAKTEERWTLGLELLQWMNRPVDFEDRAVDFAVTFEQSPPSWDAPTADQQKWALGGARAVKADEMSLAPVDGATEVGSSVQKILWSGDMAGAADPQLKRFLTPTQDTQRVEVSAQSLKHVDFVCAGAISNGIMRAMAAGRDVHVIGASPILRALLQITGVPETLFLSRKRG